MEFTLALEFTFSSQHYKYRDRGHLCPLSPSAIIQFPIEYSFAASL